MDIGARGLRFDYRAGQMEQCRQRLATSAMFLRSWVAKDAEMGRAARWTVRRNTASIISISLRIMGKQYSQKVLILTRFVENTVSVY